MIRNFSITLNLIPTPSVISDFSVIDSTGLKYPRDELIPPTRSPRYKNAPVNTFQRRAIALTKIVINNDIRVYAGMPP